MENFPNWADHAVAFIFCVLLPLSAVKQSMKMKSNSPGLYTSEQKRIFYLSTCLSLFIMAAIIISVWLLFKRPLSEIGLTLNIDGKLWVWGVILFVLIYAVDTISS